MNTLAQKNRGIIQACDATRIATWAHVFFGTLYALLAFKQGRAISNQLALEILLYISGQRQIKIALEAFGVRTGNCSLIILGNSEEILRDTLQECRTLIGGTPADEVLSILDDSKRETIQANFQIADQEIDAIALSNTKGAREDALVKIVLNRIALVTLDK
ncbi:MAG: KEOPS complex subunit Cgi121 [Candidatus Helarchaeota archaeon]|nr:KEOPS complex subunit Cgi121 [Candidatus Helarchaeota archaeon]